MSHNQKISLLIAIILFVIVGLFPNYNKVFTLSDKPKIYKHAGRHSLLNPPPEEEGFMSHHIDYRRLFLEWTLIIFPTATVFFIFNNKEKNRT